MTELFVGPELTEEQKQKRYSRPIKVVTLSDLLPPCPHYTEDGRAHLCIVCKKLMCDACAILHVHFNGLNKGEPNRWTRVRPVSRARRESALESWAVKYARARGVVVAKLTQLDGVPDRIFFIPGGRPLIIEFKACGEKPGELQQWYLKKLADDGYRVAWCDTKEKFLELLSKK